MTDRTIETDEGLLRRLNQAAKRKMTEEEIKEQRVSFIFAGMPKESSMSKVQIKETLSRAS